MDVLVNHLGYDTEGEKRAIVEAGVDRNVDGFAVVDATNGATVHEGEATPVGSVDDWKDWHFWTLEFTPVSKPGEYSLAVTVGGKTLHSRRFEVADAITQEQLLSDLLFHFRSQRSGGRYDRADRSCSFVGDREEEVDVHGGWYDASGDTSKYLSHLSYANYMNPQQIPLVVWGLADAYEQLLDVDHPLGTDLSERFVEEAMYGADFLMRMLDDEGYFYATVFDGWSKYTERREVCAFETRQGKKTDDYEAGYRQGGGVAIAALARASQLDAPTADAPADLLSGATDYSTAEYLAAAVGAFDHLEANNEAYLDDGTENVIDDYCALLAATELSVATGNERFHDAATDRARSLIGRQTSDDRYDGWFRADETGERPFFHAADEGLPVLALCRYLDRTPSSPFDDEVRAAIERYWSFELEITEDVVNPFGYARQYVTAVDEDEPRPSFFLPHENETGYWWQGENARIASLAAAAFRSRRALEHPTGATGPLQDRLGHFARAQLDWILGLNPFDVAMVRGVGPQEPEYHRSLRNAPGGIVNGVTAGMDDESDIAFCPEPWASDHDHRWRWAEQWLPHAAWFVVAICSTERV